MWCILPSLVGCRGARTERNTLDELPIVAENLDGISEAAAALYTQQEDGTYRLPVKGAGGFEIVETSKSTANMNRVRNERDAFRNKLRAFEKLGRPPEDLQGLLELAEVIPEGKGADDIRAALAALEKTGGDPDKAVEERVRVQTQAALSKHQKELEKRDGAVSKMRGALHSTLVRSEISRALAEAGVTGAAAKLLATHLEAEHVRVAEEQDGDDVRYGVEVIGADRQRRYGADGSPFSVKSLVDEMKASEEYAAFFPGSGSSGAGTKQPGGNTNNGASALAHGVRNVGGQKVISQSTFKEWARGRGAPPQKLVELMEAIGKQEIKVVPD